MRFFLALLFAALILAPGTASAHCWKRPCIPAVKCCICGCPALIGSADLDDFFKKNPMFKQSTEELTFSKDLKLQTEQTDQQALLEGNENMSLMTVR